MIIISVVLILLVLLHSGKDAGLSGAFGVGSGAGPFGGGSLADIESPAETEMGYVTGPGGRARRKAAIVDTPRAIVAPVSLATAQ